MTDAALLSARAEAFEELRKDFFQASADGLERHGPDPRAMHILAAAIYSFIVEIDEGLEPGFRKLMATMLQEIGTWDAK